MNGAIRISVATAACVAALAGIRATELAGQSVPAPMPPTSVKVVTSPTTTRSTGIWISRSELMALPTSGAAWTTVANWASRACGTPNLANQDETTNVCILAKAYVSVRLGNTSYRNEVVNAITSIVNSGTYSGRALALGRKLAAYVIAADVIDLKTLNPTLDGQFRSKIVSLRDGPTTECGSLVYCHGRKPDNWGTMAGASRIAVDLYVNDTADLQKAVAVFHGYLGDRSSYAGFTFYSSTVPNVMTWSCVPTAPVAMNPLGCKVSWNGGVYNVDGAPIWDIARGSSTGTFSWPPPRTTYAWAGMEGLLVQAELLYRRGYDSYGWENRAIGRFFQYMKFLHDDTGGYWFDPSQYPSMALQIWMANKRLGTTFPTPTPAREGKVISWTDWTHGR